MTLVLVGLLAGMALGQRFKVLVLAPAFVLVSMVAIGYGVAHGYAAWQSLPMAGVAIASLQIGYLAGIGIRSLISAGRTGMRAHPAVPGQGPGSQYSFEQHRSAGSGNQDASIRSPGCSGDSSRSKPALARPAYLLELRPEV